MTNFKIRTFGRTELAQLYCPELCPQAAFRKLNQWIDLYPNLREELLAVEEDRLHGAVDHSVDEVAAMMEVAIQEVRHAGA